MLPRSFKRALLTHMFRPILLGAVGFVAVAGFPRLSQAVTPAADLIAAINQYRQQHGLPAIATSPKLNAVAVAHVQDLATYHPENKCGGNTHSWSSNGKWKGGCYNPKDQTTHAIMWDKPQEIAGYTSYGYEISVPDVTSTQDAFLTWQKSAPHNAVILNQGMWSTYKWKAIGAACHGGYACVWFGTDPDGPQGPTLIMANPPEKTVVGQTGINKGIPWDRLQRKK